MKFKLNSFVCLCIRSGFVLLVVLFQLTSNLEAAPAGNDSQAMVSVNCFFNVRFLSYKYTGVN